MALKNTLLTGTVLGAALLAAGAAQAQQTPAQMQAQIEALNKQLQVLQQQLLTLNDQAFKSTDSPKVTVANGRPQIASPKNDFNFAVRARAHFDYGAWFPRSTTAGDLPDGFNFRRVYLGFTGKAFQDFTYTLTADFAGRSGAGILYEASVNYAVPGVPGLELQAGAWEQNFTLETAMSSNDIPFLERSTPTNLASSLVASSSRTGFGFKYTQGKFFNATYLTGNNVGSADGLDDQLSAITRFGFLAATASNYDLHIGADAAYMFKTPQTNTPNAVRSLQLRERPETRIGGGGVRFIDTGALDSQHYALIGAELAGSYDAFWFMGEYYHHQISRRDNPVTAVVESDFDPKFNTYYLAAGWVITGERRKYKPADATFGAPSPAKTLNAGGIGAWELAVRYSQSDLNWNEGIAGSATPTGGVRGGKQNAWTMGLNWYPNSFAKIMLNYQIIDVKKLTAAGADGNIKANAISTRVQFQF